MARMFPIPTAPITLARCDGGSGIEIPAHDRDFYALKQVPHGQVREIFFHSASTKSERRAFVYTPPGYDSERGENAIQCCTYNTAGAKTSTDGALKVMLAESWIT